MSTSNNPNEAFIDEGGTNDRPNNAIANTSPLSGLISMLTTEERILPPGAREANLLRVYASGVNMLADRNGHTTNETKHIRYRIGTGHGDNNLNAAFNPGYVSTDQTVRMNDVHISEVSAAASRYSAFPADLRTMDLSGIIYVLARGLAIYANTGELTHATLRGNMPVILQSLQAAEHPVGAGGGCIFISAASGNFKDCAELSAVIAAAACCRAVVMSDLVGVRDNRATYTAYNGLRLVIGCYNALMRIAGMYSAAHAGDVYTYAFLTGIHSSVTVHGHSDEAGWLRRVLRRGRFATPYGGVLLHVNGPPGMCAPNSYTASGIAQWIDTHALFSAAMVAHCAPLLEHRGKKYPWLSSVPPARPGVERSALEINNMHYANISTIMNDFISNWVNSISQVLGLTPGYTTLPHAHFSNQIGSCYGLHDHHLNMGLVAPFFWIEPTSLIPAAVATSEAELAGFSCLVRQQSQAVMPMFEQFSVTHNAGYHCDVNVRMRSARTSGMYAFLSQSVRDGLAHFRIHTCDPALITAHGMDAGRDINNEFLNGELRMNDLGWLSRDNFLPHPAAGINIGSTYGVRVDFEHMPVGLFDPITSNHLPMLDKWKEGIKISTARPCGIGLYELGVVDRRVVRDFNKAQLILYNLVNSSRMASQMGSRAFVPTIGNVVMGSDEVIITPEMTEVAPPSQVTQQRVHENVQDDGFNVRRANELMPSMTQQAHRGPILMRQADARGGAAVPVIPRGGGGDPDGGNRINDGPPPAMPVAPADARQMPNVDAGNMNLNQNNNNNNNNQRAQQAVQPANIVPNVEGDRRQGAGPGPVAPRV